MFRWRALAHATVATTLLLSAFAGPAAGSESADGIKAYLDGRPIPTSEVSRYYCDDFSYPIIQCSRLPATTQLRATTMALVASADYVTIYDGAGYAGAYMHVSQDYGTLLTIGWNDKISSFKGRNSETGTFFTDWFNGGSSWPFCCNTQQPSLGGYNNTFSSIMRT